jgi:hypothetical protein
MYIDSYLNKNFVATTKTLTNLLETGDTLSSPTMKSTNSSNPQHHHSHSTSSTFTSVAESRPLDHLVDEEDTQNLKRIQKEIQKLAKIEESEMAGPKMSFTDEEYLRVKLVVVEIHQNNTQRTFRKVLSPIMDAFDISPQFGLFHSALIVGPWYLEWNDSSLIVPRKCYSGAAVIAADIEKQFTGSLQVKEVLDKMADVICHWNATYTYSQKDRNCQAFVDDICAALNIELKFGGSLNEYLKQLRKNGRCALKFYLTPTLQKTLGMTESSVTFANHKELDKFVHTINEKDSMYLDITAPDDKVLLKSFDRAFWLRYFKSKTEEDWAPEEVDEKTYHTSCPFSHPNATKSIVQNFYKKK